MKITNKRIDELKEQIKEIPISQVIESRLEDTSLCPFHEDRHGGSFQYSDARGIYTCFSCGATGNAITFVREYDNVNFIEAVLRISYEFGLISKEDYLDSSKNQTKNDVKVKKYETAPKLKLAKKAEPWKLNIVYCAVMDLCQLTDEHRQFLMGTDDSKNERHMTPREINQNMYFSMRPFDVQKLIKYIDRYNLKEADLIGIPGFYTKDNHVEAVHLTGLGIPLLNANGQVVSIQVRRDKVQKNQETGKVEPRYIIWSSVKYENGCSCGSQIGVMEPQGPLKNYNIFITEGQFKANKLMRTFEATAITVQGVLNIDGLKTELPKLIDNHGRVGDIIVAYDMDMFTNPNVKKACNKLKNLVEEITEGHVQVKYLVWDIRNGKGCDDVINAGKAKNFRICSHEVLEKMFEKELNKNLSH